MKGKRADKNTLNPILTLFTPNLNGREIGQNDRHFLKFLLDLYQHISPIIINNFTVF